MDAELKECPFCGGPAVERMYLPEGSPTGEVGCLTTGCPMEDVEIRIDEWNQRAAIAPPVAAGSVGWCAEVNMDGLREENAELRQRAEKAEAELETWVHTNRIDELQRELAHKQAIIDRLMLEYCPDEMTVEQMAEWASHQKCAE